jgi:hypothetical protein
MLHLISMYDIILLSSILYSSHLLLYIYLYMASWFEKRHYASLKNFVRHRTDASWLAVWVFLVVALRLDLAQQTDISSIHRINE